MHLYPTCTCICKHLQRSCRGHHTQTVGITDTVAGHVEVM